MTLFRSTVPRSALTARVHRSLLALLACAALTACTTPQRATQLPRASAELTLVHLNDVYEIAPLDEGRSGGMARVGTLIRELKAEGRTVLATHGGDYLSPSVLGTARVDGHPLAGRQMVETMNAIGIDWATFGNHEFDLTESAFRARLAESRFRLVSSNVSQADGQPFPGVPRHAIVPLKIGERTVRIGLIGLTINSNPQAWVRYSDPVEAARNALAAMGPVDAVIALTHLFLAQDDTLVSEVPQIDLVLGGHEHDNWILRRGKGFTPIVKADANARSVGLVTLSFGAPGTRPQVNASLRVIDERIVPDPDVDRLVSYWTQLAFESFRAAGFQPEATVVVTHEALDGREQTVRNRPGRLTQAIVASIEAEVPGAELALLNGGSVRIDDFIAPGTITEYDVLRVLPFGGRVVGASMTGALLEQVLQTGVRNAGTGGYLHASGVSWKDNTWQVGDQPIIAQRRYRVALPAFLLTGREVNMAFLNRSHPGLSEVVEYRDVRKAVIDGLRKRYGAAR